MLKGHGDDIYSYRRKIVSNYSSNIYNGQDMTALQQHLCSCISSIHSYPQPDASRLANMLAGSHNIAHDNICVTNGATEAIYLIAQAFSGKKATILIPTFSEYEDACRINGLQLNYTTSLSDVDNDTDLFWLCNPNNPTGQMIDRDRITSFIESYPRMTIVIDQSYQYFTDKKGLEIADAIKYKNVILLHSMTKRFAIPGLRLGYITAHAELTARAKAYCMPWSVNQLAQCAGEFLVENDSLFPFDVTAYLSETRRFRKQLSTIGGMEVSATDTHFFLCRLINKTAAELKTYLADNHGILIRDASNFRGLNTSFFRLATQSPSENDNLVKIIRSWI